MGITVCSALTGCAKKQAINQNEVPLIENDIAEAENTDSESEEMTEEEPEEAPETESGQKAEETASSPEPTFHYMFDIIGGETIYISITDEEFVEYTDYLRRELDLNDAAIAGIMANLQGESGFNPNKVGDMGNAYGLCQWRGSRLDQMVAFCKDNNLNPVSREGQMAFLVHDLRDVYIYAYDLIRLCKDSEEGALQATYYFCAYYEVPADPEAESADRERLTELLIYPRLNELSEAKHQ